MRKFFLIWFLVFCLIPSWLLAHQEKSQRFGRIQATQLTKSIYMLSGPGGNVGMLTGAEGVLIVDDQYDYLTFELSSAIMNLAGRPVRFVVNTHWHADHTGGNENLGINGAVIIAHENVRKSMGKEQFTSTVGNVLPAFPPAALPMITFQEGVQFHLNNEVIQVFHVAPAHTNGDAIVYFQKANVIHMGDLFFNGTYPFVDVPSGGRVEGVIAACDKVLKMADGKTQIIPGHGGLGDQKSLKAYRDMLQGLRNDVAALIAKGMDLNQVIEAKPTQKYDELWGKGFMNPYRFTEILYSSLRKDQAKK